MNGDEESRKSMDDVLASIRRIIQGDLAEREPAPDAPKPNAAPAEEAELTLAEARAEPTAGKRTEQRGAARSEAKTKGAKSDDEDEALVLGPTMKTAKADSGAEQGETAVVENKAVAKDDKGDSTPRRGRDRPLEGEDGLIRARGKAPRIALSLVARAAPNDDAAGKDAGEAQEALPDAAREVGERAETPATKPAEATRSETERELPPAPPKAQISGEAVAEEPAATEARRAPAKDTRRGAAAAAEKTVAAEVEEAPGPVTKEVPAEKLAAEEVATEDLPAEESVVDEAAAEQPAVEEFVTEAPVTEEPVNDDAIAEDGANEDAAEGAAAEESAAAWAREIAPQVAMPDRGELEEVVRRVVRDELEGELGQRLSANILRMIRDEVAKALLHRG